MPTKTEKLVTEKLLQIYGWLKVYKALPQRNMAFDLVFPCGTIKIHQAKRWELKEWLSQINYHMYDQPIFPFTYLVASGPDNRYWPYNVCKEMIFMPVPAAYAYFGAGIQTKELSYDPQPKEIAQALSEPEIEAVYIQTSYSLYVNFIGTNFETWFEKLKEQPN
ncbi:MAG: hypothetical protein D6816_02480, partial [Bacteroidetes bacterium]